MTQLSEKTALVRKLHHWCLGTGENIYVPFDTLQKYDLIAWLYYFDFARLSEKEKIQAKAFYQQQATLDFKQEISFKRICRVLAENQIRFCPIKGADLTWRIYPAGALRPKCDLDILVPEQEVEKALKILKNDGWKVPYQYSNEHHYAMMKRQDVALELHFNLPHISPADTKAMWDLFIPLDEYCYRLPLELNLLILFHHCRKHQWQGGIKLLTDIFFLLKKEGKPDFELSDSLARQYHLSPLNLFFASFAEFFPDYKFTYRYSDEELSVFRNILISDFEQKEHAAEMVMGSEDRFSRDWILQRIHGIKPSSIRLQTGNPRGNYLKLLAGYWQISRKKLSAMWKYRHGIKDEALLNRMTELKKIEKLLQTDNE